MFDVAVIGAGPAGSAAAKRCAEHGLYTVILEKKRLPRDKVCSGLIIGPLAHTLIKQEFGEVPEAVLGRPPQLNGYLFHTPDAGQPPRPGPGLFDSTHLEEEPGFLDDGEGAQ